MRADFIEERMKYLGFRLKSSLFVLVAEFRDAKMWREHLMDYYSVALEQAVSAGHCIIYRNTLVMLISQEQKELLSDSFLQSVMKLLEEADMIGGISNRFQNIEELNIYYKQACQAIKAGRKIRKNRMLFGLGSMCCYPLFDIVRQSEDCLYSAIQKFCYLKYDSEYNTYYARTADVYFTTNMNPALQPNC